MLKWKTQSWKIIDLESYNDFNHIKNILNKLEERLKNTPEIDFPDISGSDADWAYWADQSAIMAWNEYDSQRELLKEYIKQIKKILKLKPQ